MTLFAWNLALAVIWAAVMGELSIGNLAAGFALGLVVLAVGGSFLGSSRYFEKLLRLLEFAAFFIGQLVSSSLRVAADIVRPRLRARPGVVAVPLEARSDLEITLLANLVSLTPGSLSIDVSADRSTLFVHVMFLDDLEGTRRGIKEGFERRVLELLR